MPLYLQLARELRAHVSRLELPAGHIVVGQAARPAIRLAALLAQA